MKKNKNILLLVGLSLLPFIYLLIVWSSLPASVPIHYNADFVADRFGSKRSFMLIILFLTVVTIGTALLLMNLDKIDPKRYKEEQNSLIVKIAWAVVLFLTALSILIVYATVDYTKLQPNDIIPKSITALICLFIAVLGNFMNNIQPNYFVGIRTPWALDDEFNWRKTHQLSARLWFFGGLTMFLLSILLAPNMTSYIISIGVIPLVVVPFIYSYLLFRKKQRA